MNLENDKPLREALNRWEVNDPLPPRFGENVWRRIASAKTARAMPPWAIWREWLDLAFAQRRVGLSYLAALLTLGLLVGYREGRSGQREAEAQLAARYAQSVAPFANLR